MQGGLYARGHRQVADVLEHDRDGIAAGAVRRDWLAGDQRPEAVSVQRQAVLVGH
jgi:hypothetical protein